LTLLQSCGFALLWKPQRYVLFYIVEFSSLL
jgi:hypothetical protein